MSKLKTPLFILFEGIDGSGKSTAAEKLLQYLQEINEPVVKMAEPTHGVHGAKAREIIETSEKVDAEFLLRHFIMDREDDVISHIYPALDHGKIIIMDRYYYSNAAYQGAMGLPSKFILKENRLRGFPEPDRIYLFDIDPEKAIERLRSRNLAATEANLFEKREFLNKVRALYLENVNERFKVIDAALGIDDIFDVIKEDIYTNFTKGNI